MTCIHYLLTFVTFHLNISSVALYSSMSHYHLSSTTLALVLSATIPTTLGFGPVYSSSFTWNQICGTTVACGPQAGAPPDTKGIGYAAANNEIYSAGLPITGGVGQGCGECWHLTPQEDAYQSNGKKLGTSVVVKINDQCTDKGYCDQVEGSNSSPLNTGYQKLVHFDLCNASGVTNQFFGQIGIGVATGLAEQVDCSELTNGPYGSGLGNIKQSTMTASSEKAAKGVPQGAGSNKAVVGNAERSGSSSGGSSVNADVNAALQAGPQQGDLTAPSAKSGSQPSTTLATMVSSSPPATASGGAEDEDDEQDDCDSDEL